MKQLITDRPIQLELGVALYRCGISYRAAADLVNLPKSTLWDEITRKGVEGKRQPHIKLDLTDPHIAYIAKKTLFLDIETSTILGHSFSVGKYSSFTYSGLSAGQETKILSVCYGSLYDLMTKGIDGLQESFSELTPDGVNDNHVIHEMHKIMSDMDHMIAHYGSFDKKWLFGRMMLQGLPLPRIKLVDTLKLFKHGNMLCKKLDYLTSTMLGAKKITTDLSNWIDIIEGNRREEAMRFMCKYNAVDTFLLLPLYLVGAKYNPDLCVDFTDYSIGAPQCRVTGSLLNFDGEYTNETTGNRYDTYINPTLGIKYRNRGKVGGKKSDQYRLRYFI